MPTSERNTEQRIQAGLRAADEVGMTPVQSQRTTVVLLTLILEKLERISEQLDMRQE